MCHLRLKMLTLRNVPFSYHIPTPTPSNPLLLPSSLIENESKVLLFAPYTRQNKRNAQKKNHNAHGMLAGIRFDTNSIQNVRFAIGFRRI